MVYSCVSCSFAPPFLKNFFGQPDAAQQPESQLGIAFHCNVGDDLLKQPGIEAITDFRFFKDLVKRFQFIEKFIVFILGQLLSALNPQSGEFVPDISGLSGII